MDTITVGCVSALVISVILKKRRKRRRWWVHPLLSNRLSMGYSHTKFNDHRKYPEKFFQYYCLSINSFDELLGLLYETLQKNDTNMRRSIHPAERIVITLRYLATGSDFACLEYVVQVSKSSIRLIIKETCIAIWKIVQPLEMPSPSQEKWLEIADQYYRKSNFPNCVGAIDDKHIRIVCPPNTGTALFNYKKFFSIVLLAVTDADYCFTAVDVGSYGREADSNIFKSSNFGTRLAKKQLNLPGSQSLPNSSEPPLPYVFVADEAFALNEHLLRPYARKNLGVSQRVFNYRLTRARRFVECSFGILPNKWRIFHTSLLVDVELDVQIVQATCVLHNFVRRHDGSDTENLYINPMQNITATGTGGRQTAGEVIREEFKNYFVSDSGEIPWQYEKISNKL